MHIEIDQSGKIEDTSKDTVLAFSNKFSYSVLIPAVVKRKLVQKFKPKYKSAKRFNIKLFSVILFILLKII